MGLGGGRVGIIQWGLFMQVLQFYCIDKTTELETTVQSKEFTSGEQANLRMLRTADDTKWENQMPKLKVVDARACVRIG